MAEFQAWIKKAKEDLAAARFNMEGGFHDVSIFFSPQAAEKALKALLLKEGKELIKTHDLVTLATIADAPAELIEHAKALTLAYTYTRYPGLPQIKGLRQKAEIFLNYAEDVVKWTEKSLRG
ncbi:MAG: HEPN domain-containing protein [Candidatus Diapherotrites archaeon]|uniref:HEPN domain-containing protein n=1 Tax=Candidatus Iainarchaeum sp. TaxID=3101447 RepID=A0A8T3YK95_9ARCH|nr:HEPN domain-containing protein [Candidatus Diapherotrites archaeon]